MEWSDQQLRAIDRAVAWGRNPNRPSQIHRLFGYAGAGKTELAKTIASQIGRSIFCAYTGKAASVLRARGCEGATTIHSLIYTPAMPGLTRLKQLEDQYAKAKAEPDTHPTVLDRLKKAMEEERESANRMTFVLNPLSDAGDVDLIVVDECSMVDARVGEDLLSFGTPVLVLGDPAQLPPVRGSGFFINDRPDTMLTEIHRQAADNPIIQMATTVRQGGTLALGNYGTSRVIEKADPEAAMAASQIICGKNATRRSINTRCRSLYRYPRDEPIAGDKIVCLANDHEIGILNGTLWTALDSSRASEKSFDMIIRPEDGGQEIFVEVTDHHFLGREGQLSWWDLDGLKEFDYGYALTCHKSQGSQWSDVMIFDESWVFRADRSRWLYTAITRAQNSVTVVRM